MHKVLKRIVIKIASMILICCLLSIVFASFAPILNNNLALTQMENSDIWFATQQTWIIISNSFYFIEAVIVVIFIGSIILDIIKYNKNKEENY